MTPTDVGYQGVAQPLDIGECNRRLRVNTGVWKPF